MSEKPKHDRAKRWLVVVAYSVWGACGFFFICAGVNPIIGALFGLVIGFAIGQFHGVRWNDAWSGAFVWALRGVFLGAMAAFGVCLLAYRVFSSGFHDDQDIIVYAGAGSVIGGLVGAVAGWFLGIHKKD
jgi:hypothetical protein